MLSMALQYYLFIVDTLKANRAYTEKWEDMMWLWHTFLKLVLSVIAAIEAGRWFHSILVRWMKELR